MNDAKQWWLEETFNIPSSPPIGFLAAKDLYGPSGPAVVQVFGEKTSPGWGKYEFKQNYRRMARQSYTILPSKAPYAWIMRSMNAVVIDIDGKNGGLELETLFGVELPPTTGETSKSGNGYHLFYKTDDRWDPEFGFAAFNDRIGVAPGVDIRAVGCVYHFPQQEWNIRQMAQLPAALSDKLKLQWSSRTVKAKPVEEMTDVEVGLHLVEQDELLRDLAEPIPDGRRNTTLFAIGAQMYLLNIPDWAELIEDRATELGLEQEEVDGLVDHIPRYADRM